MIKKTTKPTQELKTYRFPLLDLCVEATSQKEAIALVTKLRDKNAGDTIEDNKTKIEE